ncbi:oxysterol-binding protein-related protein 11-like isoform X1 [Clytia hemisphaerica]|uniref:Oxysterol-binding protein n=2 Tax=Clytia hemisphaerica TaxID=252671 RepID=A0A7M5X3E3_9CNID
MDLISSGNFPILNPTLNELNLEGLSKEERSRILAVIKKEQDFSTTESTAHMNRLQKMEGQLSKFTNLMKGWQFRWFVLDPESGTLTYFLDKQKQKNRGTLPLSGAVISPSDEDSMSFMISAHNGDLYKLRAIDAKERQHWINLIRAVAEYHSQNALTKPARPPAPTAESSMKRSNTTSAGATNNILKSPGLIKSHSLKLSPKIRSPRAPPAPPQQPPQLANPIQEELKNIKDALNSVAEFQSSAVEALENGPPSGEALNSLDEQVLLLKATSQATVNILQQCYSILQQQSLEVRGSAQTTSLPPGAKIKWFEPQNKGFINKSGSTTSEESIEEAMDVAAAGGACDNLTQRSLMSISQHSEEEVEDKEKYTDEQLEDMEPHKSVILHLLSQLKLGMDLTRVVLPTFVLEKRSLLEMYADFLGHSDLFTSIPDRKTPEDRMLAVLEFYLTSFHVGRKSGVAKKPYNPILGEYFVCSMDTSSTINNTSQQQTSQPDPLLNGDSPVGPEGRVYFVAEQVSHHPPISAFYAECPSKKICMNTHIWTKSKFYGMSIGVINVGEGVISLPELHEDYIITFPNAYCRSILTQPWIELGGRTLIRCPQSGYSASVTFHTKPFYGGKLNRVTFEVKNSSSDTGQVICHGEGSWDGKIQFNYPKRTPSSKTIDVKDLSITPKRVRPVDKQLDYESRKLWQNVTESLIKPNLEKATEEKHKLEERQRKEAKERVASGTEWKTKLFKKAGETYLFNQHIAHVQRNRKSRTASTPNA